MAHFGFGKVLAVTLGFGAVAWLGGCDAAPANAPVVSAVPSDPGLRVQDFPPASISFQTAELFLWKADTTADDVQAVLGYKVQYDALQDQLYLLGVRDKAYRDKFAAIQVDVSSLPDQIGDLAGKQQELGDAQTKLAAVQADLAQLQAQTQPYPDDIQKKITQDQAAITLDSKRVNRLKADVDTLQQSVQQAQTAISGAGLNQDYSDWQALQKSLGDTRQQTADALVPISNRTWIFNSDSLKFSFVYDAHAAQVQPAQAWQASIKSWDLSAIDDPAMAEAGAPTDFSTQDGGIQQLGYGLTGGVFAFEVHTPGAVYWFKIARSNYGDLDGRTHYEGDIVRCSVATGGSGLPAIVYVRDFVQCGVKADATGSATGSSVMRRGIANLIDIDDKS